MKNRQRGFTLIEMLVVITVGSVLSGIAVLMLHALLKSHDTGREHMEYCRTIDRLAEQFRNDIHAMDKTSSDKNEKTFDLLSNSADNAKIRYECLPDRIDRTELRGDKIVRSESYMLPPGTESSIKTDSQQNATVASILILPKQQTSKIYHAPPVRIEAVLGRDSSLFKAMPKSATEDKP